MMEWVTIAKYKRRNREWLIHNRVRCHVLRAGSQTSLCGVTSDDGWESDVIEIKCYMCQRILGQAAPRSINKKHPRRGEPHVSDRRRIERFRRVNAKRPPEVRLESTGTQALDDAAEILIRWMDELRRARAGGAN